MADKIIAAIVINGQSSGAERSSKASPQHNSKECSKGEGEVPFLPVEKVRMCS